MLAYEYLRRTGDLLLIREIWPSITLALDWLDNYGDLDGDGFVEYSPWGVRGLVHQGWKDSHDSVFHRDGKIAEPPIALCEVQGYTYAAKLGAAQIAIILGEEERAHRLLSEAELLKRNFHERFWDSQIDCYALALDGRKNPCSVRTSNAGHALFSGIAESHAAAALVRTLFQPDMFSGWGVRTVSTKEVQYNPLSYHNGSIWPHDTAMIAYGLAQYGYQNRSAHILATMLEASSFIPLQRMPELYCGFERREGQGPTLHPIACSPQAWAAASSLCLIQACLGLSIDALERRIVVNKPFLPESVERLEIHNILVGDSTIDLGFQRYAQDVGVHVLRRGGDIAVSVLK
jgi:glycogen debranching enzyme